MQQPQNRSATLDVPDVARPATLTELLQQRANRAPHQVTFTFLSDDGSRAAITNRELDQRARSVAWRLSQCAEPGQRAVLMYPPGLEFLTGFFGCLYAGILPVPSSYPKPRRPLPRHTAIVADCDASLALTDSRTQSLLNLGDSSSVLQKLEWISTDLPLEPVSETWVPHVAQANDIAFLQYTSGSTSEPKGVMLTHANLLHNLEVIRDSFNVPWLHEGDSRRTSVFWLPAYHDMGLIGGLLGTLYTERHAILMSPASFLQRPVRWLRAMSEYRATVSGAPNFAYELCVQRTTPEQRRELDLSHWKLAFCGAEPIHHETLDRFAAAFAESGFRREALYPCYGLAENSLMVTGGESTRCWTTIRIQRHELAENRIVPAAADGDAVETRSLVGCGWPRCGQSVRVVNPKTRQLCRPDEVGEIWVQGMSVAAGYWKQPAESKATFNAQLAGGEGPFLRTGDLGFIRGDELFITGRRKDLIIIRGQNHYPQDIELTAASADDRLVPYGATAFHVDSRRGERLVIVQEVKRHVREADGDELVRKIRVAVAVDHELDVYGVQLIRAAGLPRTSSGKVQRRRTAELFAADELPVVYRWRRSDADVTRDFPRLFLPAAPYRDVDVQRVALQIEHVLLQWLRSRAGIAEEALHRDKPFAEMGVDSLSAVELSYALETWLELELSPVMAWNFPTPARMAAHLARTLTGTETVSTLPISSADHFEALLEEIEAMDESDAQAESQSIRLQPGKDGSSSES